MSALFLKVNKNEERISEYFKFKGIIILRNFILNYLEMKNKNIEYEILVKEIYKHLLRAEGFENIEVKHDVKILAKSGCTHQIDVYWEYKLGGEIHRIAIDCKNYSKKISIAKVRDFFGVIYDIGNIKGVLVTRKGFQSGAKQFADYYTISLKELRKPDERDWENRVKTIDIKVIEFRKNVTNIHIELDVNERDSDAMINKEERIIETFRRLNTSIFISDENGSTLINFLELERNLPHNYQERKGLKHTYTFDNGYLESNLGRVKISYIEFEYDVDTVASDITLEAEELTKAIIRDVKTMDLKFINYDGTVR